MAKPPADWYFNNGVDVRNRRVFLVGDFEEPLVADVIKGLYYLDTQDQEEPIELFVSSLGGSEYEMFALYDVMMSVRAPISTVAIGKCQSAAPLIVAAGALNLRYTMPSTQWMVHMGEVSDLDTTRYDELAQLHKHLYKMTSRWCHLMEKHTGVGAKEWKKLSDKTGDNYFESHEAIEYGLVDHIWGERMLY